MRPRSRNLTGRHTWQAGPARRVVLAAIVIVLLSNSVPLALLPVYQDELGLRPAALAAVAAGPTLGVLMAIVIGARLSDAIGRRPVLLGGLVLAAAGVLALLVADGLAPLLLGRMLTGAGVALASAAGMAALLDFAPPQERQAAAVSGALAVVVGIAVGPAVGGLVVQYLPFPLRMALAIELALVLIVTGLLVRLPESVPTDGRPALRTALRPRLPRTPARLRPVGRAAALAVTPAWAVMGLVVATGPGLLTRTLGVEDRSLVAAALASFLATSAIAQFCLGTWSVRRAGMSGAGLLLGGLVAMTVALHQSSTSAYAASLIVLGVGHGLSQASAQSAVGAAASPGERGSAFGALLVVTYLSSGGSSLAVGYASQAMGQVPATTLTAVVVAVVAGTSFAVTARSSALPEVPCAPPAVPCH